MNKSNCETAASPTVSCIIIFLNEERFLPEAVASVLTQTYADWELLLVDDGSTDRSSSIARAFAAADPGRIRYLAHEGHANLGMSASRNLGLLHARGRLVAFLDADDVWLKDKLAKQVALFARYPEAVMVCGATEYWSSWDPDSQLGPDRIVYSGEVAGASVLPQDQLYAPPELMRALYPLGRGASPSVSGFMVTRALTDWVGGFENEFRGIFEDQVFRIKAYLHGPIYVSSDCFDRYRQHVDSCVYVARASGAKEEARRIFLHWAQGYVDRAGCLDRDIRARLRWALLRSEHPRVYGLATTVRDLATKSLRSWPFNTGH